MEEIELIDNMISQLRAIKSTIKKKDRLSQKCFDMDPLNHTPKQIQKAHADLNWECMDLDKQRTNFARSFKNSPLDVDTGVKEYRPSGFHTYRH